jgi:hypothetical protein
MMPEETQTPQPIAPVQLKVKPKTLALITGGGLIAGTLIVVGAIMPAEYNVDPLGLGKLSGVARLWAPEEKNIDVNAGAGGPLAREFDVPLRTDTIEIPLSGFLGGAKNSELEYKVRMKPGATFIYEWSVAGAERDNDFHFDFHGHTTPVKGEEMTVATYKQAYGLKAEGALTAPFDGIQGWQFSNSGDKPVVVTLKLTGFYDLIPAGEEGNLAGIVANVPAEQSRPGFTPQ